MSSDNISYETVFEWLQNIQYDVFSKFLDKTKCQLVEEYKYFTLHTDANGPSANRMDMDNEINKNNEEEKEDEEVEGEEEEGQTEPTKKTRDIPKILTSLKNKFLAKRFKQDVDVPIDSIANTIRHLKNGSERTPNLSLNYYARLGFVLNYLKKHKKNYDFDLPLPQWIVENFKIKDTSISYYTSIYRLLHK